MPSVAELDRLQALVNQLVPLTKTQQGDLIKAQDWNTVVGALIEVTRASLEDGAPGSVPPHEHPDQVAPGWLTPALRSIVERGSLADPAADARISQIQSRLDSLAARIEGGSGDINDLRLKINDVVAKHLALVADFNTANRAIQGAADAREDVLGLRDSLGTIQKNLQAVQAATLVVDGQPANLQAIADRIKSIEAFRGSLTMTNGQAWDGAALEHRLADFSNTFVTQNQLNDALNTRPGKLTDLDRAALHDQLSNELTVSTKQLNDQAAAGIRDEVTQRLAGVDAQISRAVADSIPGSRDAALAVIRPEVQTAVSASAEASKALLESRLSETSTALTGTLGSRIDDVQRGIAPALQAQLDQRLPAALADFRSQLDLIGSRTAAIEGRLTGHDQALTGLGSRIDSVAQADVTARDGLRAQLGKDFDTKLKTLSDSVDVRFKEHTTVINRLDTSFAEAKDTVASQASDAAGRAVSTQIGDMATTLRAEMHQAAKDEVSAANTQLTELVTAQVQKSLADLPGLVDTHVRSALGDVQSVIDTRLNDASTRIQADVKSRVDEALSGISPQVTKAVKDSLDAQLPGVVDAAVKNAAPKLVAGEVKTQINDAAFVTRIRDRIRQ